MKRLYRYFIVMFDYRRYNERLASDLRYVEDLLVDTQEDITPVREGEIMRQIAFIKDRRSKELYVEGVRKFWRQ